MHPRLVRACRQRSLTTRVAKAARREPRTPLRGHRRSNTEARTRQQPGKRAAGTERHTEQAKPPGGATDPETHNQAAQRPPTRLSHEAPREATRGETGEDGILFARLGHRGCLACRLARIIPCHRTLAATAHHVRTRQATVQAHALVRYGPARPCKRDPPTPTSLWPQRPRLILSSTDSTPPRTLPQRETRPGQLGGPVRSLATSQRQPGPRHRSKRRRGTPDRADPTPTLGRQRQRHRQRLPMRKP